MKKILFVGAIVLGTYAFSACESKPAEGADETIVDTDTIVETDTAVEVTTVETDTNTTIVEGDDSTIVNP